MIFVNYFTHSGIEINWTYFTNSGTRIIVTDSFFHNPNQTSGTLVPR